MGFFVRGVTRRNLFAIGAVLAGGPFIAFNLWLHNLIERQGPSEMSTAAKRAIALAEARVRDAVGTLDARAVAGVSSLRSAGCGGDASCRLQHDSCQGNCRHWP